MPSRRRVRPQLSRRQFLRSSGALGLVSLSGCSSLDRLFLGEYQEDAERVTIVGAGLAGLTAAFQLKKLQIPFHIYEASSRIGGRILSVPNLVEGQPVAEMGAEWFSSSHKYLLNLAKELHIDTFESRNLRIRYREGDRIMNLASLSGDLVRLQRQIRNDQGAENNLALDEWVRQSTKNVQLQGLINEWALQRFGSPMARIPAGVFWNELRALPNGLGPWLDHRFRFRQGMGALTESLFERVAGFQPERTFLFNHRLRSVEQIKRGYQLRFETPRGRVSVACRNVICAIPVSGLSAIDGMSELPGPWDTKEEFAMGNHAKFVMSFSQRFWVPSLENSRVSAFSPGQEIWESTYKQNPMFQMRQGILTSQSGGDAAQKVGPDSIEAFKSHLFKLLKAAPSVHPLDSAATNWGSHSLFKGSIPAPYAGRRPQLWKNSLRGWHWAGDYVSDKWRGTLNGAVESATAAVQAIAKAASVR